MLLGRSVASQAKRVQSIAQTNKKKKKEKGENLKARRRFSSLSGWSKADGPA